MSSGLFIPLPDPTSLDADAALAHRRFLRRQLRPAIIATLAVLYRSEREEDVIERLCLEIWLRQLDDHIAAVNQKRWAEHPEERSHRDAARLVDVRREAADRASAVAPLAWSAANCDCVHGPLAVMSAVALAETLLGPGESLTALESVTWARPIRTAVRVTADAGGEIRTAGCASFGTLSTSDARRISFTLEEIAAAPVEEDVDVDGDAVQLLLTSRIVRRSDRLGYTFHFDPALTACIAAARTGAAPSAGLSLDLATTAMTNVRLWLNPRLTAMAMVDVGVRSLPLANPTELLATGATLEVVVDEDGIHASRRSGLRVVPMRFRFLPRQVGFSSATYAEADSVQELMAVLHSAE